MSNYRIATEGNLFVIQKEIEIENYRSYFDSIFKKRTFRKEWRDLDKYGLSYRSPYSILNSHIEYYKTREQAISVIEKWTKPVEYFYPPDYNEGNSNKILVPYDLNFLSKDQLLSLGLFCKQIGLLKESEIVNNYYLGKTK